MADVLFLPGIVAPAATRYAPLLAELPGVHGVPKDLELYRVLSLAIDEPAMDFTEEGQQTYG